MVYDVKSIIILTNVSLLNKVDKGLGRVRGRERDIERGRKKEKEKESPYGEQTSKGERWRERKGGWVDIEIGGWILNEEKICFSLGLLISLKPHKYIFGSYLLEMYI